MKSSADPWPPRGRQGKTSAATGARALVMVAMVKKHGLKSMPVNTGLQGVPQIVVGLFGLKTQYSIHLARPD